MPSSSRLTRRSFVAATASALALPYFVPRRAFGANDRVVTGFIGVRNQGTANLKKFMPKCDVAALCDVDTKVLADAVKLCENGGHKVDTYGDYRDLLARKDIDAVVVTTPDHWHALMTIHACQAGKDVYCEKPLSLTVSEGRKMVDAARKYKRVVQTGSQQRSDKRFRLACELVRNGRLGKLDQVLVGIPNVNFAGPAVPDSDPPAELNYDFWLGPAPYRPYNEKRVHYLFRFFWDYSGGQMTNFGAHHLDIAQWALDMDNSGPVEIQGSGTYHAQNWYEVCESARVTYTYANGVQVILGQGQKDIPGGVTFVGSKGRLFVDRRKIESDPPELATEALPESAERLYVSDDHAGNFLSCIRSRELPICDAEIGHRSATVCHLGNIAIRTGRTIRWDPQAEQIVGDSEANSMLARPYRSPWTL